MQTFKGVPISKGIAVSDAFIFHEIAQQIELTHIKKASVRPESQRYENARLSVQNDLESLLQQPDETRSSEDLQIIQLYVALIMSDFFTHTVPQAISDQMWSAESALLTELEISRKQFESIENPYFRERFLDFKSLSDQILLALSHNLAPTQIDQSAILVGEEISAVTLLRLPREYIKGIITSSGGITSHAAFLTESMNIPAIFAVPGVLQHVMHGDPIVLDGYHGTVIVEPDPETLLNYEHLINTYHYREQRTLEAIEKPNLTKDQVPICLMANVGFDADIKKAQQNAAQGIGLYRTEMLCLKSQSFLSEEEQIPIYEQACHSFPHNTVTFRLIDLGGDKFFESLQLIYSPEDNPFLGNRSIRLFAEHPQLLKEQIRAILTASAHHAHIRILIPMVTTIEEVRWIRALIQECVDELTFQGTPFCQEFQLGAMVEIPSAAAMIRLLLKEVSFVSVGTNDLIQYANATDRGNPKVAHLYTALHPGVLRMLYDIAQAAQDMGKSASICGEIARNPLFTRVLMGMGYYQLSLTPEYIPLIKTIAIASDSADTQKLWENVQDLPTSDAIRLCLEADLATYLPDIFMNYVYE